MESPHHFLRMFHRAQEGQTIASVHRSLLEGFKSLNDSIGLKTSHAAPEAPPEDCRGGLDDRVWLTDHLGPGVTRAIAKYAYRLDREYLKTITESGSDDNVIVDFDSALVDIRYVVRTALPRLIEAYRPYRADLCESEFFELRTEQWKAENQRRRREPGGNVDGRDSVMYLQLANYWDAELCDRAFGLRPPEVVTRVKGHVPLATTIADGALVALAEHALSKVELVDLNRRLRPLLPDRMGLHLALLEK